VILSELGSLDLTQILFTAAVVFFGGFLRGFVGFGGALVIIPVLAVMFTPKLAVVVHAIMELPGTIQLLPTAVRHCARRTVLPIIIALVVGIPVGVYALTAIDPNSMRIVISVLVLVMVAMLTLNTRIAFAAGTKATVAGGVIGGIIQGVAGIGGPPIVTLLLSRGDGSDTTRGNIVVVMSSLIIVVLPVLWFYGLITSRSLILGGIAAPVYLLATYLGSRYFQTGGKSIYRVIALLILALTAISTLVFSFW